MPEHLVTDEQKDRHAWQYFQAAPLQILRERSVRFRQLGTSDRGGPCIVGFERHCDAVGKTSAGFKTVVEYDPLTAVTALTVALGGEGNTYWYPYVATGVGECDIDYDVEVGATALTAGMNGCSLRIYANPTLKQIKFCHDNNGSYANDQAYAKEGYWHVQSINADEKMRGHPSQNVNNYWKPSYDAVGSGVYFVCKKTGDLEWTIYQSVVLSQGFNREQRKDWRGRSTIIDTYKFSGRQEENKEVAKIIIPRSNLQRSASQNDLPANIKESPPRRNST